MSPKVEGAEFCLLQSKSPVLLSYVVLGPFEDLVIKLVDGRAVCRWKPPPPLPPTNLRFLQERMIPWF